MLLSIAGNTFLFFALVITLGSNIFLKTLSAEKIKFYSGISFLSMLGAYSTLLTAYLLSSLELANSYQNSHYNNNLIYKIAGTWGNHEGSILLWTLLLYGYNFLYVSRSKLERKPVYFFHSLTTLSFLAYSIFVSNPFTVNYIPATEGMGFNPLLQDIALAFHPPLLYFGYTCISLLFAMAMSIAFYNTDIAELKGWLRLSWGLTTGGVALGSWWAYRQLGWGGFWFWDPVENSSLVIWLLLTAALHTTPLLNKISSARIWLVMLVSITFIATIVGTWLIRSGVLISVHSFASHKSSYLLAISAIFAAVMISALIAMEKRSYISRLTSKDLSLLFNQLIMVSMTAVILISLFYPVIYQHLYEDTIAIGPDYFNTIFYILALPLIAAVGLTPLFLKGKFNWTPVVAGAVSSFFLNLSFTTALSCWAIFSNIDYYLRYQRSIKLVIAHTGFLVMIVGILLYAADSHEESGYLALEESISSKGYKISLQKIKQEKNEVYHSLIADFVVEDSLKNVKTHLFPEVRVYNLEGTILPKVATFRDGLKDIYLAVGEVKDGKIAVKFYLNPGIIFIWVGAILMAMYFIIAKMFPTVSKGQK